MKQRFEREARGISALNHPHICTLHDLGNQDGTDYLVMELLEGESLAERLKKGALPLNNALKIGIELSKRWKWRTRQASSTAISNRETS